MNLSSRLKNSVFSITLADFPYRFNPSPNQIPTGSCAFWPLEKAIVLCLDPPIKIDPPTTHTQPDLNFQKRWYANLAAIVRQALGEMRA